MIDTGAGVSLVSAGALHTLKDIELKPASDVNVTALKGFGCSSKIPIEHYIEKQIVFENGFVTPCPIMLFVVPIDFMTHNVVLGAVSLKDNNLLPDLTRRELVHRVHKKLKMVGKDISYNIPFYNCVVPEITVLKPLQCRMVSIVVEKIQQEARQRCPLVEFQGMDIPGVSIIPGILDLRVDNVKIAIINYTDQEKRIKRNTLVGNIKPAEKLEIIPMINELKEAGIYPEQYWNVKTIISEFQIEELNLTIDQKNQLIKVLQKHVSVLSTGDNDVGVATNITHNIELESDRPVRVPVRRVQGPLAQEIEKECKDLLEGNIIRPSKSPFSAPVVPVRKPDGSLRLCIDYRKLNNATKGDSFPLPNLIDMIYNMYGNKFFTTIDLIKGYYQINMDPDSVEKTAFSTPFGQYEYLKMPFGVKNGPATFQRGMMLALAGLPWNKVMVYLDDIIILGKTFEDHLNTLDQVLIALGSNGYKLKPRKTKLCREEVEFLGHRVSDNGIMPLDKNLKGVLEFPIPTTVKQLRQFLGMVNFYRRHIPNCSQIAKPLSAQTGGKTVSWNEKCQNAFDQLKQALVDPILLGFPDYSAEASPMELHVDASDIGAGASLSQKQNGVQRPIAYISTTFNGAQKNYSTIDKELTALRWAVKSLKAFLKGVKFVIYTDHQPLIYLQNMSMVDGRVARTWEELNEFDFEIRHIVGKSNLIADALSRSPVPDLPLPEQDGTNKHETEFVPPGFEMITIPGGGDALFMCFSLFLYGTIDNHLELRVLVIDELLKNIEKYKLKEKNIRKQLNAMKLSGHIPKPEVIEAFCKLFKVRVQIFYKDIKPMMYGPPDAQETCSLKCLGGVHYNYLRKQPPVIRTNMDEIIINIHSISPVYDQVDVTQHNIPEMDIIEDQKTDSIISYIIKQMKNQIPFTQWNKRTQVFKIHLSKLMIKNDILYYQHSSGRFLYVLSFNFIITVVINLHWKCAHIGRNKILELLYRHFWHPRVNQIVSDIVRCCPTCQKFKTHSTNVVPPTLKIMAKSPFDLMAMDLLQFPITRSGNKYAVVLIDHFTKWACVVPIQNKQSDTVARVFKKNMLPFLLKIPNRLLTDNGTEFVSANFQQILSEFNIQHIRTTPLHPASNGVCERFNRSLIQSLKCLVLDHEKDWDEELPASNSIYNHTYHSSLKTSPTKFILNNIHPEVSHSFPQYWDEGTINFQPYKKGQKVAKKVISKGHHVDNKFKIRWEGPFLITKVNENKVTYSIRRINDPNAREEKQHFSHLRKWIEVPNYLKRNPQFADILFRTDDLEDENLDVSADDSSSVRSNSFRGFYESDSVDEEVLQEDECPQEMEDNEDNFLGFTEIPVSSAETQNLAKSIIGRLKVLQSTIAQINKSNNKISQRDKENSEQSRFLLSPEPISSILDSSIPTIPQPCLNSSTVFPTVPMHNISYIISPSLLYSSPLQTASQLPSCSPRLQTSLEKSMPQSPNKEIYKIFEMDESSTEFRGFESFPGNYNKDFCEKSSQGTENIVVDSEDHELEWDHTSMYVHNSHENTIIDPLVERWMNSTFDVSGENGATAGLNASHISEESSSRSETQSPGTLRKFLEDNFGVTQMSTVPHLDCLPDEYSIEGELILRRRLSRENAPIGSPTIVIETPVVRPLTRSQGAVPNLPNVMSQPLEYGRSSRLSFPITTTKT
ncbi:UNVERIFIED_CONTAM: hypothetical protein RMT77_014689 [Armadillidium vulgare]